jgi:hypothetical protein
MTVAELPPELWYRIASFLPMHVVQANCMVHRVFFDMTMKTMYERIVFSPTDHDFDKLLIKLQYAFTNITFLRPMLILYPIESHMFAVECGISMPAGPRLFRLLILRNPPLLQQLYTQNNGQFFPFP